MRLRDNVVAELAQQGIRRGSALWPDENDAYDIAALGLLYSSIYRREPAKHNHSNQFDIQL